MICAFAYTYFPPIFAVACGAFETIISYGNRASGEVQGSIQERVVEVI
jgi:hypothetical protein